MREESLLGCTRALGKANDRLLQVKALQERARSEAVQVREVVEPLVEAFGDLLDAVMILLNEVNSKP
jgi:predicted NBD/HSP70 family sugar kinase